MPQFQVDDMTCKHCEATITKAIQEVDANATVSIDLSTHKVMIASDQPDSVFANCISEAGYTPIALSK